jgi:predicted membrane channel-forming protein YqfA (hemolysin III family)
LLDNIGTLDRVIRADVGVAVALVAMVAIELFSVVWFVLLGVSALLPITALVGFCPTYRLVGIRTCRAPKSRRRRR